MVPTTQKLRLAPLCTYGSSMDRYDREAAQEQPERIEPPYITAEPNGVFIMAGAVYDALDKLYPTAEGTLN